jgi:hypothetical protein
MSWSPITGEAVNDGGGKGISGDDPLCRLVDAERTRSGEGESRRLNDLERCRGDGRGLAVCMLADVTKLEVGQVHRSCRGKWWNEMGSVSLRL